MDWLPRHPHTLSRHPHDRRLTHLPRALYGSTRYGRLILNDMTRAGFRIQTESERNPQSLNGISNTAEEGNQRFEEERPAASDLQC